MNSFKSMSVGKGVASGDLFSASYPVILDFFRRLINCLAGDNFLETADIFFWSSLDGLLLFDLNR